MKDPEFIELLNLYLDHEISAADAARLEAEVQTNAARRRIYQQYCRMQKACRMVVADFQTDPDAAVAAEKKDVIAFDPTAISAEARRKRVGGFYVVGTFAAMAACVAIIFVGRNRPQPASETPAAPAVAHTMPVAEKIEVNPTAANPAATRGLFSVAQRPTLTKVTNPLLLTGNTQADAVFAAAVQQANNQLAWIDAVQLTPLQPRGSTNDLHFDATLRSEERALGGRASSPTKQQPASEMSAFQFIK